MTENPTTPTVRGLRGGHVTCQKRFQPLAPSSEAASWRSGLIVWSPASSVIAKNGMPRHVLTVIAHHIAYTPSERNGSFVVMRPPLYRSQLSTLKVGSNIQRSEEHTSELQSLAYLVC